MLWQMKPSHSDDFNSYKHLWCSCYSFKLLLFYAKCAFCPICVNTGLNRRNKYIITNKAANKHTHKTIIRNLKGRFAQWFLSPAGTTAESLSVLCLYKSLAYFSYAAQHYTERWRKTDWLKHEAGFPPSLWMWLCVDGEQGRQSKTQSSWQ